MRGTAFFSLLLLYTAAQRQFNVGILIEQHDTTNSTVEKKGYELALRDANLLLSQLNVTLNSTVKCISQDDMAASTKAAFAFAKSGAIFGAFSRTSCTVLAAAAASMVKPMINPMGCLNPDFVDLVKYPTLIRLEAGVTRLTLFKDLLVRMNSTRVHVITTTDFPIAPFASIIQASKLTVTSTVFPVEADIFTKRSVALAVRDSGLRHILVLASHQDTRDLFIEFDQASMNTGYAFFAAWLDLDRIVDETDTPERNAAIVRASEGCFFIQPWIPRTPAVNNLVAQLGVVPTSAVDVVITTAIRAYDGVMAFATNLAKVLRTAGPTVDPNTLNMLALNLTLNTRYFGVSGIIAFTPGTHATGISLALLNVQKGQLVYVGNWSLATGSSLSDVFVFPGGVSSPPPSFLLPASFVDEAASWWADRNNRIAVFLPIGFLLFILLVGLVLLFVRAQRASAKNRQLEQLRLIETATAAERERDIAQQSNQNKRKFLRYMMHELRVPFHVLDIGLQLLKEEKELPSESRAMLNQMGDASNMMSGLMNDMLDMQRIEDGRFETTTSEFDPLTMLRYVVDAHSLRTKERGISIALEMADERNYVVLSDEIRLRQCASNLLDNAIKFSPDGGRIDVTCLHDGRSLIIRIKDQGPGISLGDRAKLFEVWSQINAGEMQKGKGSGLGLSLVKTIMTLLGGEVGIDGAEGEGACFVLNTPCVKAPKNMSYSSSEDLETQTAADEKHLWRDSLKGLRVLAVDDNAMVRSVMMKLLSQKNAIAASASNGHEACLLVEKYIADGTPFDFVLMDKEMPVMDGHEACERIHLTTPVFGLTGNVMEEDVVAYKSHGATAVLAKPLRIETLLRAVHDHKIRERKASKPLETHHDHAESMYNGTVVPRSESPKSQIEILRRPSGATLLPPLPHQSLSQAFEAI